MSLPSSRSNSALPASCWFLSCLMFNSGDEYYMVFRNAGWFSTGCTALYTSQKTELLNTHGAPLQNIVRIIQIYVRLVQRCVQQLHYTASIQWMSMVSKRSFRKRSWPNRGKIPVRISLGHRLFWLRSFVTFLSTFIEILGEWFDLGDDQILLHALSNPCYCDV
jgi:hypothetical protein